MVCLIENYIFYIDVFLLQNFLVKMSVLYLTLLSSKQLYVVSHIKGAARLIGVALLGTVMEVVGLFLIRPYAVFIIFTYVIEIPIMLFLLSPKNKIKELVLPIFTFLILINGVLECLWNYFGRYVEYMILVGLSSIIIVLLVRVWHAYKQREKGIYPVRMVHKDKELFLRGYYDSGNCLKDPYGSKGIHIISCDVLKELTTEEDYRLYVPYQSLGNKNGVLEMVYIDRLCVYGEKEIELKKVPMGAAEDELFKNKPYKIILNEEVF